MYIDMSFAVRADAPIPADHGYLVYAALSGVLPAIHGHNGVGIHPIRGGHQLGNRQMSCGSRSRLIIRTEDARIPELMPVAGVQLAVGATKMHVGVPEIYPLRPTPALRSRLVTIKLKGEGGKLEVLAETNFREALHRQMSDLTLSPQVLLTLGKRRTLRVRDKNIVGYEVLLEGLTAAESLTVQEVGLGGRRHMGCGIFVGVR